MNSSESNHPYQPPNNTKSSQNAFGFEIQGAVNYWCCEKITVLKELDPILREESAAESFLIRS